MESDHVLVLATLTLKPRKPQRREERQRRFDTGKVSQVYFKKRFRILQEEQELNIDSFNQALMETSKKLLGYRRKEKEELIKSDTWTTIDERKPTKKQP